MKEHPGCWSQFAQLMREYVLPIVTTLLVILFAIMFAIAITTDPPTGYVSRLTHRALITPDEHLVWTGEITTAPDNETFAVIYRKGEYSNGSGWFACVDINSRIRILDDSANGTVSRIRIWFHGEDLHLRPADSEEWQRFQYLYELTVLAMKAEQELVEEPPTPASPPPTPPKAKAKTKSEASGDDPWAAFRD